MALRGKVDRAILTRAFETVQQGTLIVTKLENLLFSEVADLKDQEVKESLIEARKAYCPNIYRDNATCLKIVSCLCVGR